MNGLLQLDDHLLARGVLLPSMGWRSEAIRGQKSEDENALLRPRGVAIMTEFMATARCCGRSNQ